MTTTTNDKLSSEDQTKIELQSLYENYKQESIPFLRDWKKTNLAEAIRARRRNWINLFWTLISKAYEPIQKISQEKWQIDKLRENAASIDDRDLENAIKEICDKELASKE